MMNAITLEALGITKDELAEKLLDRLVDEFTTDLTWDEDGHLGRRKSTMSDQITAQIKGHIDTTVERLGNEHVLPRVTEMIENLVIQATNKWGEKQGAPTTFIEYLVARADAYMREEVDINGKTKAQGEYGWRKHSTRITQMVDKHLQHSIETAMKKALADANSSIAGGLQSAVKMALAEAQAKLSVTVKTK